MGSWGLPMFMIPPLVTWAVGVALAEPAELDDDDDELPQAATVRAKMPRAPAMRCLVVSLKCTPPEDWSREASAIEGGRSPGGAILLGGMGGCITRWGEIVSLPIAFRRTAVQALVLCDSASGPRSRPQRAYTHPTDRCCGPQNRSSPG